MIVFSKLSEDYICFGEVLFRYASVCQGYLVMLLVLLLLSPFLSYVALLKSVVVVVLLLLCVVYPPSVVLMFVGSVCTNIYGMYWHVLNF